MVKIRSKVWISTPYSLIHGYEYFGGALWDSVHGPSGDGESIPRPTRLHGTVTRKTKILNLTICNFQFIVSLFAEN